MPHWTYILFLFALGACIGSFLNVVVWRLPRGESLSTPPSHCPKCDKPLKWYDNIPILGWIKLAGKCRFCREPISIRYPIVELLTALLFVFFYVMYYMAEVGPTAPLAQLRWADTPGSGIYVPPVAPIFLLHLFLISCLLSASLIDLELYEIPQKITLCLAAVSVAAHAIFDDPYAGGSLNLIGTDGGPTTAAALAAGGTIGLAVSFLLKRAGVLKPSFPEGGPMLEIDRAALEEENKERKKAGEPEIELPPPYTRRQIAAEMRKEMAYLLPPMLLAIGFWLLVQKVPAVENLWGTFAGQRWGSGLLGSLFGGLVGGFVVWLTRILGTLGFGKEAMGLGDVDLMAAVGCCIGAGASAVAFFLAPFFGMLLALYLLVTGSRKEIPYGPYLSLASAAVLLVYAPIAEWLEPGLAGLGIFARQLAGMPE